MDKIAEFCGWTPEEFQEEIDYKTAYNYSGICFYFKDEEKKKQYPYYFDFDILPGGGFATELSRIRSYGNMYDFIKGLDTSRRGYGVSELETIVRQLGATIVSKEDKTTRQPAWGLGSDGSFSFQSDSYETVYIKSLVFDYNGVRYDCWNSVGADVINQINALPIR